MNLLLVFAGGMVGAPLRYLVDRLVAARHDTVFPLGTFAVNVTGSALLGALAATARAGHLSHAAMLVAGTGFCGSLTTFSTFSFETVRLLEEGSLLEATLNTLASLAVGLAAATVAGALTAAAW